MTNKAWISLEQNIIDTAVNEWRKRYQNLIIDFQVTVKNVGDVFLRHSVLINEQTQTCYASTMQL